MTAPTLKLSLKSEPSRTTDTPFKMFDKFAPLYLPFLIKSCLDWRFVFAAMAHANIPQNGNVYRRQPIDTVRRMSNVKPISLTICAEITNEIEIEKYPALQLVVSEWDIRTWCKLHSGHESWKEFLSRNCPTWCRDLYHFMFQCHSLAWEPTVS